MADYGSLSPEPVDVDLFNDWVSRAAKQAWGAIKFPGEVYRSQEPVTSAEMVGPADKAAQIDKERASAEKTRAEAAVTLGGGMAGGGGVVAMPVPAPVPESSSQPDQNGRLGEVLGGLVQSQAQIVQALGQIAQTVQSTAAAEGVNSQKIDMLITHLAAPTEVVRDENGRVVSVRRVVQPGAAPVSIENLGDSTEIVRDETGRAIGARRVTPQAYN